VKQFADENVVPMLIKGKYDELQTPDPYKGISEAFGGWYNNLSTEDKQSLKHIQREMEDAVGEDADVLVDIIPSIRNLIMGDEENTTVSSRFLRSKVDDKINKKRLHFVFQCFIKSLITEHSPMILFIDDLQWADTDSLELLVSILSDSSIKNVLFVGAFRSNEVHGDHALATMIIDLEMYMEIEMMELSDLSKEDVGEFIGDTLNLEAQDVLPLTEAIFTKTLGNMFFTMQALEQLVRRNALYYDMMVFRWQWVLSKDRLEELLSNGIVEMVKSKIQHMPFKLQKALMVASHTRSTFDVDTLTELINTEHRGPGLKKIALVKLLDRAVLEGLLVNTAGSEEYSFAHDRIREAAGTFVSGEALDTLLVHIRNVLSRRGFSETDVVLQAEFVSVMAEATVEIDLDLAASELGDGPMRFAKKGERSLSQQICVLSNADLRSFQNLKNRWKNRRKKRKCIDLSEQMILRFARNTCNSDDSFCESRAWKSMKHVKERYLTLSVYALEEQLSTKVRET
jgi:predicted ATPase